MNINTPRTTRRSPTKTTSAENIKKKNLELTLQDSKNAFEKQTTCSSAEEHFVENENSKKVLLAMVVGLKDENDVLFDGNYNTDAYPTKQRRKWMPILADFVSEIKMRKLSMGQNPKLTHR